MRKILIILIITFISTAGFGHINKETELTKKERKARRKAEQAKQDSLDLTAFMAIIESKQWVLEAYQISFNNGRKFNVTPALNFIAIENEEAFIQIGSNSAYGYNGIGGISIKGKATRYTSKVINKYGSRFISIVVNSPNGTFDIRINVNASGELATASVQGATTGGELEYCGKIVTISESIVYKGRPLI